MRAKWLTFAALSLIGAISHCGATIVTFDDLPRNTGTGSFIPNDYQGLVWSNSDAVNAILNTNVLGVTGYYYGMVSASNVAVVFGNNAFVPNSEIDSTGTNFNFLSAYLTGAWRSNISIEVQGFRNGSLLYNTTVVAAATSPTPFTFDYMNVDRLYFNSYGGDVAFGHDGGNQVVMDNFDFEFVPEPSAFLLTAAGALMLWSVAKGKRG